MLLYENTNLFMRQIRILISGFFYVPISPTFCGQYIYIDNGSILTLKRRKDGAILCILDKRGVNSMTGFIIEIWFAFRVKKTQDICTRLTLWFHHTINTMVLIVIRIIPQRFTVSKGVVPPTLIWVKNNISAILKVQNCFGTHKYPIL